MTVLNRLFPERLFKDSGQFRDWFVVEDGNGVLDVPASFASRHPIAIFLKLAAAAYLVYTLTATLSEADQVGIYFCYLSAYALIFSVVYSMVSLFNSLASVEQPRRLEYVPDKVCAQWLLFNLAMHANMLSLVFYWGCYDRVGGWDPDADNDSADFTSFSMNGGTFLALVVEGFIVNRIPIRSKFWWGTCLPVAFAYVGWTYVHSLTDIGNPTIEGSDLLYAFFDWNDDLYPTVIRAAVSVFFVSPTAQSLLLLLSYHFRRHADLDAQGNEARAHETNSQCEHREEVP